MYFIKVVDNGVEFFAENRLITIFSAPAYCGQFDNNAGLLTIDAALSCTVSVRIFRESRRLNFSAIFMLKRVKPPKRRMSV